MKVLNFNGTIYEARAGSASQPGISFAGDPNTGIYSPGAYQLAISTNGVGRLFVDSTGTVNIVGAGTAGSTQAVSFNGSAPVNSLVVDSSGRCGIGTSAPGSLLDIGSGSSAGVTQLTLKGGSTAGDYGIISIQNGSTQRGRIVADASADHLRIDTAGGASTKIQFKTGASYTDAVTIDASQRVGIGTTSPSQKLEVNGNIRILNENNLQLANTGDVQFLNAAGTSYSTGIIGSSDNMILYTTDLERARIDSSGRLLVGTSSLTEVSVNAAAKYAIKETSAIAIQKLQGNSNSQGSAQKHTIVRHYPVVSSGTKLIIPFVSQGSLNSTTTCKVWGHSARFNNASPLAFEITFALGHLTSISNLSSWGGSGNFSSIAASGMNIEITFATAYTSATANGLFVCIEYMTNYAEYSIDVANIAMN